MRCMMAVMLMLGFASLNSVRGQDPTLNQKAKTTGSDRVQPRANEPEQEEAAAMGSGGIVTVGQLKVSDKVARELQRSDKALRAGDVRGSAEHIAKALVMDPELAVAHNALGARYAELKEYDKAVAEFEKAAATKRNYRLAEDNLTVVLCLQHRYAEAEPVARRALEMEPEARSSQYLLGSVLVEEGENTGEAVELLESAKEKYPRAWLFLAKAAEGRGETEETAKELREYLKLPEADQKLAGDWLAKLEKKAEE